MGVWCGCLAVEESRRISPNCGVVCLDTIFRGVCILSLKLIIEFLYYCYLLCTYQLLRCWLELAVSMYIEQ